MASEDGSPATTQERDLDDQPAISVKIPHSLDTQGQAADYGGWATYHLAGTEQPQPILPFDSYRHRATIIVNGPLTPGGAASVAATGSAAITAGGQTVVSELLPAGTYTVSWNLLMSGTVTVADVDNAQLMLGATVLAIANVGDTTNTTYPQVPVTVVVPSGGAVLSVQSIGAGSGTATYRASVSAVQQPASGFVYLGTQAQCLQKLGGVVPAGQQVVVENNQQLWMAPDGVDPVIVSVLAERWDSGT
jgi:hypothetical protein